ncbi:LacI family DNA-binding transcriptional regulator [Asanoa hainanensis]|uniref:LacI family DNA-binding transcriptional regulator n=1 Tax=Asanoa hainanensis TaxID=560556 RepID=UPI001FE903BC|nr:LacI family DNA-binding transcriptional regulator [Asanoa hainanensis]
MARLAGVSTATASKALNERAEVAPATRERVLKAAEVLAFQPNVLARGLMSGRTGTIGLLTDELGGRFSIPILLGVENTVGNEMMSVLLCDARGDAIRRRHYLRTLLARSVDGLIVVGESNDLRPSLVDEVAVPVVYAYGESDNPDDLSIISDDRHGATLAAEHLLAQGRQAIGHITGEPTYRAARERASALGEVLERAGQPIVGGAMFGDWTQRWARHAARTLLAAHPGLDAIFCGSDQLAVGVTDTLNQMGVRIPDDVALVGYDNWEAFSAQSNPPLTTIDTNLQDIGAAAAKHLFDALGGEATSGVIRHPTRLVVRESTGPRTTGRATSGPTV